MISSSGSDDILSTSQANFESYRWQSWLYSCYTAMGPYKISVHSWRYMSQTGFKVSCSTEIRASFSDQCVFLTRSNHLQFDNYLNSNINVNYDRFPLLRDHQISQTKFGELNPLESFLWIFYRCKDFGSGVKYAGSATPSLCNSVTIILIYIYIKYIYIYIYQMEIWWHESLC